MAENVVGTCPWCERHNVELYIVTGVSNVYGPLGQYVCGRCRDALIPWRDVLPVEEIKGLAVRFDDISRKAGR